MTLSIEEVHRLKQAPLVEGVLPLFHSRWSPRAFSGREVSPADLARVFEAARWAPSSNNEQPWRFLVGFRNSATHDKIHSALVGFNKTWAGTAPVLILGAARATFSQGDKPNRVALYDLGAAAVCLTLQASALGIAAHQMAGFDQDAARSAFAIPEEYLIGAVIALGYQGEPAALANEQLVVREVAPRQRKPLSEFVFSSWGTPQTLA